MNNSLSFLDINIVRGNDKFATSVYHKPTFSGVFTDFEISNRLKRLKNVIFVAGR